MSAIAQDTVKTLAARIAELENQNLAREVESERQDLQASKFKSRLEELGNCQNLLASDFLVIQGDLATLVATLNEQYNSPVAPLVQDVPVKPVKAPKAPKAPKVSVAEKIANADNPERIAARIATRPEGVSITCSCGGSGLSAKFIAKHTALGHKVTS